MKSKSPSTALLFQVLLNLDYAEIKSEVTKREQEIEFVKNSVATGHWLAGLLHNGTKPDPFQNTS